MPWTNYHSHSHFCDGKYSLEEHVKEAISQKMPAFGFSSHVPVQFPSVWNMPMSRLSDYLNQSRLLKEQYQEQIQLYTSFEIDFIPEVIGPSTDYVKAANIDYTLGSVHYVDAFEDGHHWEIDGSHQLFLKGVEEIFKGDVERAVRRYFQLTRQMVQEDCPEVIGHLDKIKMQNEDGSLFSETSPWYQEEIEETLLLIAEKGAIVEVNTRGLYKKATEEPYPSKWILERMKELNIPIMLNSDSHHPRELTMAFEETAKTLLDIGFSELYIFYDDKWQSVPFTEKGLVL